MFFMFSKVVTVTEKPHAKAIHEMRKNVAKSLPLTAGQNALCAIESLTCLK